MGGEGICDRVMAPCRGGEGVISKIIDDLAGVDLDLYFSNRNAKRKQ